MRGPGNSGFGFLRAFSLGWILALTARRWLEHPQFRRSSRTLLVG